MLAVAGLAMLAPAGCGGQDDVGRADFVARAEAICAEGARGTAPLLRRLREAARATRPEDVFRRTAQLELELAEATRSVVDRVEALPQPSEDDALERWLADLRRARSLREELASAYAARNLQDIARTAAETDRLDERTDAWARRTGMPACARLT